MRRAFLHDPLSGRRYTMLTSTFSHDSITHFLFNAFAFTSFAAGVASVLDRSDHERNARGAWTQVTPIYEVGALLIAGGLASSVTSHIYANRILLPRAVRALSQQAPTIRSLASAREAVDVHAIRPSLGLSGAVYAMVALDALSIPDARIGIIFLPFFSLPIGLGVSGLVCMDIIGLVRGWRPVCSSFAEAGFLMVLLQTIRPCCASWRSGLRCGMVLLGRGGVGQFAPHFPYPSRCGSRYAPLSFPCLIHSQD